MISRLRQGRREIQCESIIEIIFVINRGLRSPENSWESASFTLGNPLGNFLLPSPYFLDHLLNDHFLFEDWPQGLDGTSGLCSTESVKVLRQKERRCTGALMSWIWGYAELSPATWPISEVIQGAVLQGTKGFKDICVILRENPFLLSKKTGL